MSKSYSIVPFLRRCKPYDRRKQKHRLRINDDIHFQVGGEEPMVEWTLKESLEPKENSRFHAVEYWNVFEVKHNFNGLPDLMAFQTAIDDAFESAMKPYIQNLNSLDLFGCYIENPSLKSSIYLRPTPVRDFDKRRFLDRVFKTSQSSRSFLNDGLLRVRTVIYKSLTGRGRGKKAPVSFKESISRKQSVVVIRNNDNSCGYRAVAIGMKYHEWSVKGNARQSRWKNLITRGIAKNNVTKEFCTTYCFDPRIPVDNAILKQMDERIKNFQIIVIKDADQFFKGTERSNVIYLLFDGEHYDLITSMPGYLKRNMYCKECNRGYTDAINHRCMNSCFNCRSPFKCIQRDPKICQDCQMTFVSSECYENHKKNKICIQRHYCMKCEDHYAVEKNHKHDCDENKCHLCSEYYTIQPHFCHIKPLELEKLAKEDKENKVMIAYDIESMIEKKDNNFSHRPILLISNTVCDLCPDCEVCGQKERIFYGIDCVEKFVEYLLDFSKVCAKKKTSITVFAHNNSGYDGHWILRELMRRDIQDIEPILNGTKIMKLDVGNVRFIDSLLLFQRPLADLPKMFGLDGMAKGFFPHYANTPENQSLVCRLEDLKIEMFGRQVMSQNKAQELDVWYSENRRMIFMFREEMIKYCRSDVRILLEAVMCFRKLFIETTEVDPLSRTFTLASIGLEFFRAKLLPEKVIGVTPVGGYNNHRQQSFSANAWLDLMEEQFGESIIREYKFGKYFADGMIEKTFTENGIFFTRIGFEYNGCRFHGHNCGNNYNRNLLDKVEEKRQYYLRRGVYPVFVWECEFKAAANGKFWERFEYHQKMTKEALFCDPRKALHGGRTNNIKFTHIAREGEEMRYLDFTSLYPYVLSHHSFPASHPIVIRSHFPDINNVFGFFSCKVLPPIDLYLPVLPYSCGGKLTFPLCRTCAEQRNNNSCQHREEERCLIGTFVSVELQKALELGYKVIEIYEILHYPKRIDSLFKSYVDVWYKIKAESSGYPSHCIDEKTKVRYLSEFKVKEGIDLEKEKVTKNPGLRTIAKLMFNSFWGKLAQRPNMTTTKIVKGYQDAFDIFNNQELNVTGDLFIEDMLLINYNYKDINKSKPGNTSVAVASFVTAYARLKLYEEMEKIEMSCPGSVLYFDTDSIVFVHRNGNYCPKIGSFLGEMTDEISEEFGMNAKMSEFHTLGPKTYGYKVETENGPIFKLKVKGISQNIASEETCNFERIRTMAQNKAKDIPNAVVLIKQQQFRCDRHHVVTTLNIDKQFNVTSDKRRVLGNDTLPYGFVDEDINEFTNMMCD